MGDKEFIVTHGRAREPLTVTGKNLREALEKEGLDPAIWAEVTPPEPDIEPPPFDPELDSKPSEP